MFFTHSIYELIQQAKKADAGFALVERAAKLDQYYIPSRYPNALLGGVPSRFYTDPEEAREAVELARSVVEMVEGKTGQP